MNSFYGIIRNIVKHNDSNNVIKILYYHILKNKDTKKDINKVNKEILCSVVYLLLCLTFRCRYGELLCPDIY